MMPCANPTYPLEFHSGPFEAELLVVSKAGMVRPVTEYNFICIGKTGALDSKLLLGKRGYYIIVTVIVTYFDVSCVSEGTPVNSTCPSGNIQRVDCVKQWYERSRQAEN